MRPERLGKEIKRRMKVLEVFPDECSVERLLYFVLREIDEKLTSRRLRGFNEDRMGPTMSFLTNFLSNKKTVCEDLPCSFQQSFYTIKAAL
jgi:hypothetical protein